MYLTWFFASISAEDGDLVLVTIASSLMEGGHSILEHWKVHHEKRILSSTLISPLIFTNLVSRFYVDPVQESRHLLIYSCRCRFQ